MAGFRRKPDRRPTPVVNLAEPIVVIERTDPELPEPDLTSVILPDQELADAHRYAIDEAYRLAAWTWGHEFGVSWAAYVAGLPLGSRWTWDQVRELAFLRWLYQQGRT